MRSLSACLALICLCVVSPLSAQVIAYETVDVDADPVAPGGERTLYTLSYVVDEEVVDTALAPPAPIARGPAYGPFRLIDETHAALVDVTDARSPGQFAALLREHPRIAALEMIECPGTEDDLANLRVGRMIREHGIATHVPTGGSVRSGGVELFLAGAHRYADPGAEFAVHSWQDDTGLEPADYAANAPENRRYLDYYRQMGMSPAEASAFYAMTNSVPFSSARWFGAGEMASWVKLDDQVPPTIPAPSLLHSAPQFAAVLDSGPRLQ
jgi:hypothetical protein